MNRACIGFAASNHWLKVQWAAMEQLEFEIVINRLDPGTAGRRSRRAKRGGRQRPEAPLLEETGIGTK